MLWPLSALPLRAIVVFMVLISILISLCAQAAPVKKSASVKAAVTAPADANTNKVFEMLGKIYIKKELLPACETVNRGFPCSQAGYGDFRVLSEKQEDSIYSLATFADQDGIQVIEKSWVKDGKIQKGILENKQVGYTTVLEVRDGTAFYDTEFTDGRKKSDHEKAEENLVLPSSLIAYLKPKFPKIINGETVPIRMAVMDKRESFRFDVSKDRIEKGSEGQDILVMKMKGSSFIVSKVVDPMFFFIDLKKDKILGFEGRSALARKEGSKWKPLDVKVAYNIIYDQPKSDTAATKPTADTSCLESETSKCVITK